MNCHKPILPLLAGALLLTGCTHTYVMKLTDGAQITTASKPKLREGIYYWKDAKGEENAIGAARVREIAPASLAQRENKQQPIKSERQNKRKWYYLWLA